MLLLCLCHLSWAQSPTFSKSTAQAFTDQQQVREEVDQTAKTNYYDPLEAFRMALVKQVKYPDNALQMGHAGKVIIRVQLLDNGHIGQVRIIRSAGPILDQAVLQAAAEVMHRHQSLGLPVRRSMDFPVIFRP